MSKLKPRPASRNEDQKSAFDSGYNSYEDGNRDRDSGAASEALAGDPHLVAMWRHGWQRAREDSALS